MTKDPSASSRAAPATTRDPAGVLAASTFSAGVALLPPDLREDATILYCLLRAIDDLVDEGDPRAGERVRALATWARQGSSGSPEANAMASLSERHALPPGAVLDFCAGMRHDLEGRALRDERALDAYCHQVAGTVGELLTALFGGAGEECRRGMEQLGRAMQLTNILRDLDEDRANGRSYVPLTLVDRYGPPLPGRRAELLRVLIERADELYEQGLVAIPLLKRGGAAMSVSVVLYRETLREIERDGMGRREGRVQVPAWRMRRLIARAKHASSPVGNTSTRR